MAGTFTFLGIHFIFSTRNRDPFIDTSIQDRLHAYIGGIIREQEGRLIEINSMPDHIHIYTHMPEKVSVSKFMEIVKTNSSRWIHQTFSGKKGFAWQGGFGAFSAGKSMEGKVIEYIRQQKNHHRKKTFQEELIEYLEMNQIQYDERYIWR